MEAKQSVGPYQLEHQLAEVGLAQLWTARKSDSKDGEPVALKLLRDKTFLESNRLAALLDEARAASVLEHTALVRTLDLERDEEGLYIAMQLVRGPSLAVLMQRQALKSTPLPPAIVIYICERVAAALQFASETASIDGLKLRLVHRHVSPHNILIDDRGLVRLSDLGILASEVHPIGGDESGTVRGKPSYMAPEQVTNGLVDERSDVFSLGIVAYEASCLKPLFGHPTVQASMDAVRDHVPQPLTQLVPGYPDALWMVIQRCLEKDPARRFQNMAEVAHELRLVQDSLLKAGSPDDNLARIVTMAFPEGSFQPGARAAVRRVSSISSGQPKDAGAGDGNEVDFGWPVARGLNPLDPREIGNLRAKLYEQSHKARSTSQPPVPAVGSDLAGKAAETAKEAAQETMRVLEDTMNDPRGRRIGIAAAVAVVVFLVLIALFTGTDPEFDRELKALYERADYQGVEKHFVSNHSKYRYFETAFVLASDARIKLHGGQAPSSGSSGIEAPPGPGTEIAPAGTAPDVPPGTKATGEKDLLGIEPMEDEPAAPDGVAVADAPAVEAPETDAAEELAIEEESKSLSKADQKVFRQAKKHAVAGKKLLRGKNYKAAERQLQVCIQVMELPECHLTLGQLYRATKDDAKSVRHLERYLGLAPGAKDADEIRKQIRQAQGRQ